MVKESKQRIECFHCKRLFPLETMISGELIRPPVAELILKRLPDWTSGKMLCPDCLHLFRSEYVEDVLEDEKGELSRLDRAVLQSLKEQETVTENLNLAFEKDLTAGQYIADRVAAFGGSWIFIIFFFVVLVLWMAVNSTFFLAKPFDPYPFILLNLVLSCLAALQAPTAVRTRLSGKPESRTGNPPTARKTRRASQTPMAQAAGSPADSTGPNEGNRYQKLVELQQRELAEVRNQPHPPHDFPGWISDP
jgi:Protein of unknown function (DUF1003)